jgi:hypothetical protein
VRRLKYAELCTLGVISASISTKER